MLRPFHLAVPVTNLERDTKFYTEILGCKSGRFAKRWMDIDFFGHQLALHLIDKEENDIPTNLVDGKNVPARHFGIILEWNEWHKLKERLASHKIEFIIKPYIRFSGEIGEQATMFFRDPSGNYLEFKAFKHEKQLFAISEKN